MTVLTAGEGHGLQRMVDGLQKRFRDAGVDQPELLYVDRDCCGKNVIQKTFSTWKRMEIRLDIWHFIRRIAVGCTTDAHQLYASFMANLSRCIFQWDRDDLNALLAAKRSELEQQTIRDLSDSDVMRRITKSELALHCRRVTRGADETSLLIQDLIQAFSGVKGCDTLGVPLIHDERMKEIIKTQLKHVPCIQDPPNVQLYQQTGTSKKGKMVLPIYRCARGSTSLESFHLHLNRFIPGTRAKDTLFQAYLLDGLARWNEDRASAAIIKPDDAPAYSGLLQHTANLLSEEVLGIRPFPAYRRPRAYTGELIGIEYLCSQTGQALQDYKRDIETMEELDDASPSNDEDEDEDENIADVRNENEDPTIPVLDATELPQQVILSPPIDLPQHLPSRPPTDLNQQLPSIPSLPMPTTTILRIPTDKEYSKAMYTSTSDVAEKTSPVTHQLQETSNTDQQVIKPEESVGPDNISGFDKVQALSNVLVALRLQDALSNEKASDIVEKWNQLSDYDRRPIHFPARHKSSLTKGRFRATKTVTHPRVESTRRCLLGMEPVAASWPDVNRIVESVVSHLCQLFQSSRRTADGQLCNRWTLILRAYKRIQQCILNNAKVINETGLQLPAINQATLMQWYRRKGKAQERIILEQGLSYIPPSLVADNPVIEAVQKPQHLQEGFNIPFQYHTPINTAGTAKFKRRRGQSSKTQGSSTQSRSKPMCTVPSTPAALSVPSAGTASLPTMAPTVLPDPSVGTATPSILMPGALSVPPAETVPLSVTTPAALPVPPAGMALPSLSQIYNLPVPPSGTAPSPITLTPPDPNILPGITSAQPVLVPFGPPSSLCQSVPYSTQRYRKKKIEQEEQGILKRKYETSGATYICGRCKKPRVSPGHLQYMGHRWCEESMDGSVEEWRARLKKEYDEKRKGWVSRKKDQ